MKSIPYFDRIQNSSLRAELLRAIRNHWTHDSTALEGNTLTLGDTDFVLTEGLTVSGKPLSHHQEVYGHAKAIDLVYGLIDKPELTVDDLFMLHKAVLTEFIVDIYCPVGSWKNEPNTVSYVQDGRVVNHAYPYPEVVPVLMDQWLMAANQWADKIDSPEAAIASYADLHAKFVAVHPFYDGNGRMARLLANVPLLKNGYPPINIPVEDRHQYLDALVAVTGPCGDVRLQSELNKIVDAAAIGRFGVLCKAWWSPILELVESAVQKDAEFLRHTQFPAGAGEKVDPSVDAAYEGKVLAIDLTEKAVFQSKGRGGFRLLPVDLLSRVPEVGEMMRVTFREGRGQVADKVADKGWEQSKSNER